MKVILAFLLLFSLNSCTALFPDLEIRNSGKNFDTSLTIRESNYTPNKNKSIKNFINGKYHLEVFNEQNNLIIKSTYADSGCNKIVGKYFTYFDNGNLESEINYNNDSELDGLLTKFYKNGKLKREDFYKEGNLINGTCYDSSGNKVDYTPLFVEPLIDLNIISNCLKYPSILKKQDVQEKLLLKILISKNGEMMKVYWDKNNDPLFVHESINCIPMGILKPAYEDGEAVSCWITIPLAFRLK